jgi:hypothetical protein
MKTHEYICTSLSHQHLCHHPSSSVRWSVITSLLTLKHFPNLLPHVAQQQKQQPKKKVWNRDRKSIQKCPRAIAQQTTTEENQSNEGNRTSNKV